MGIREAVKKGKIENFEIMVIGQSISKHLTISPRVQLCLPSGSAPLLADPGLFLSQSNSLFNRAISE